MQRSGCEGLFVVGGAAVAECGVPTAVVVEHDPPEHVAAGVGFGYPAAVVDVQLSFEGGEERLGQRVVVRRADPPHRAADAVTAACIGEVAAAVLGAPVRVEDHAVDPGRRGRRPQRRERR